MRGVHGTDALRIVIYDKVHVNRRHHQLQFSIVEIRPSNYT